MAQVRINSFLRKTPKICTPDTSLVEAAELMRRENCGSLAVVKSLTYPEPIGVITDRDIVCRSIAEGINPMHLSVKECMTNDCDSIRSMATVAVVIRIMESKKIHRMLVVDRNGLCLGIISKADLESHITLPKEKKKKRILTAARPFMRFNFPPEPSPY